METVDYEKGMRAVREVMDILSDIIAAHGQLGVPSGHLYAMVMSKMSLNTYQMFIDALEGAGKIRISNHVLYWRG